MSQPYIRPLGVQLSSISPVYVATSVQPIIQTSNQSFIKTSTMLPPLVQRESYIIPTAQNQ